MKKIYTRKKKALISCMAGAFLLTSLTLLGGITAWATPSTGYSVSDEVNVRDNAYGNLVGALSAGQEVSIHSEKQSSDGYTWYEITFYNGVEELTGWVRSDLLSTEGQPVETPQQSESNGDSVEEQRPEEGTDASEEVQTPQEAVSNGDGTFTIGSETYTIADAVAEGEIPEGFEETTITYAGLEVPAAKFKETEVFLLYLESESDGRWCVYDHERDAILPFVKTELENGYVILINVPEEIAASVSDIYAAGKCAFGNGYVIAYQQTTPADNADKDAVLSDFYYVYGLSDSGNMGWYLYDASNDTLQRSVSNMQYQETAVVPDDTAEDAFQGESIARMVVSALGLICLLLLLLTIIFSVRYRRLKYIVEDEYEEEETQEDYDAALQKQLIQARKEAEKQEKERKRKSTPDEEIHYFTDEAVSQMQKPARQAAQAELFQIKSENGTLRVELPNETVDILDFDDEFIGGYDFSVPVHEDYDLTTDNTVEDEKEFEEFETNPQDDDDLEFL